MEDSEDVPVTNISLYSRISTNLAIIHVAPITESENSTSVEFNKLMQELSDSEPDDLLGEGLERSKVNKKSVEGEKSMSGEKPKTRRQRDHARVSIK